MYVYFSCEQKLRNSNLDKRGTHTVPLLRTEMYSFSSFGSERKYWLLGLQMFGGERLHLKML